jgi:hypothetical protein
MIKADDFETKHAHTKKHVSYDLESNSANEQPPLMRRLDTEMVREIEHTKIEGKKIEQENIYKTACCDMDKRMIHLVMQVGISGSILGFCFYKLSTDMECPDKTVFISIITSISGFWLSSNFKR